MYLILAHNKKQKKLGVIWQHAKGKAVFQLKVFHLLIQGNEN